ncbi:hypothetical protein [Haliangium sp.]|uniref:hypothetical protein n=1 Tax=Haliangium sp. TaxID=2663208 RepID=UPI003D141CBB
MTWAIEADVDVSPDGYGSLCRTLAEVFASDLACIVIDVTRGDWPIEEVASQTFAGGDIPDGWLSFLYEHLASTHTVRVRFALHGAGALEYRPDPEIRLYGDDLAGDGNHRRRTPVVLGFGNRKAWRGNAELPSGLNLGEDLLVQTLRAVCSRVRPRSLYLVNEEQVSIPFNDHFVFHSEPSAYLRDLEDIVQLCLHGGDGRYRDARARYEPALHSGAKLMFCKRQGDYLESVLQFLAAKLPQLEARGLPEAVDFSLLEPALLANQDSDFFFVEDGVGVYHVPLFQGYVEAVYFELAEALLARG